MKNKNICPVCGCNVKVDIFDIPVERFIDIFTKSIECPVCGTYRIAGLVGCVEDVREIIFGIISDHNIYARREINERLENRLPVNIVKNDNSKKSVISVTENGEIILCDYDNYVNEKVALIRQYLYNNADKSRVAEKVDQLIFVNYEWCENVCRKNFPTSDEQLKYLIEFLGKEFKYSGSTTYNFGDSSDDLVINKLKLISATASINDENLKGICDWAAELKLIKISNNDNEKVLQFS